MREDQWRLRGEHVVYPVVLILPCECSMSPIHQEAPEFADMNVDQEILETGIKVVDLLAPYTKGGKIGKDN